MLIQRGEERGPRGEMFSMDELLLGTDPFAIYGSPNAVKKESDNPKLFSGDPFIHELLKPCNDAALGEKSGDRSRASEATTPPVRGSKTADVNPKAVTQVEAKKTEAKKQGSTSTTTTTATTTPPKTKTVSPPKKKKKFERPKIVYRRKRLDLDTDEYRDRAQALLAKHTDIILQKRKDAFFQLLKQLCPYIVVERSGSRTLRTYLVDTRRKKRYRTYSDAIKGGALDPLIVATGTTVLLKGCIDEAQRRFAILKRQAAEKKKQEENERNNSDNTQQTSSDTPNQSNEAGKPSQNIRFPQVKAQARDAPLSMEPCKQPSSRAAQDFASPRSMLETSSGRTFKRKREENNDPGEKMRLSYRATALADPFPEEPYDDLTFPEFYPEESHGQRVTPRRCWNNDSSIQQGLHCDEWSETPSLLDVGATASSRGIDSAFEMFHNHIAPADAHDWLDRQRDY